MDIQSIISGLDALFANRKIDQVEDYLSSNLESALKEGDTGSAIAIINELIGFYRSISQYDKAEAYCEKLLPFLEKTGLKDTVHYGTSCLNIANVYRASGRLEDSFLHYQKVFEIYKKCLEPNDYLYAGLNNNLSLLYQEMGQYDKACEALKSALDIIKQYPEAVLEEAVTYTNLAASYVKAGEMEQAKRASESGLSLFTANGLEEDYHCSAAKSVAGDIYFACGQYKEAATWYEAAMCLLRQHVGITQGFFRIVEKLDVTLNKLGKKDGLKGLPLSKDYFNEFGSELAKRYPDVCFGKIGEGSECFGLDDILSMDHDFGPGFCIFLSSQQYEKYSKELERSYDLLPNVYRGLERSKHSEELGRNGVIVYEDFFKRILDLRDDECAYLIDQEDLPKDVWLRLQDWQLKTVTNGEIFSGKNTKFGKIYEKLKAGYPQDVKRRKIAQKLGNICQEGQYNYPRMMIRQDITGAIYLKQLYLQHSVECLYLLNDEYAPHEKWLFQLAKERYQSGDWSVGKAIFALVEELSCEVPDVSGYADKEMTDWIGKRNTSDLIFTKIEEIALLITNCLKQLGYTESDDTYLESHIPFVLQDMNQKKMGEDMEHTNEVIFQNDVFFKDEMDQVNLTKEDLVERIVALEWAAFDKVDNLGGRAGCQDDESTFTIMRKSQYLTWPKELLLSFYIDFIEANDNGWNLITEKYGRMMESTAPQEYDNIKDRFPECSEQKRAIINQIADIQVDWMETFAKNYPCMAGNARTIRSETDHIYNTSYETYLKGELMTYSDRTLGLYGQWIVDLKQKNQNLAEQIMTNTALLYGYDSLDAAENALKKAEM